MITTIANLQTLDERKDSVVTPPNDAYGMNIIQNKHEMFHHEMGRVNASALFDADCDDTNIYEDLAF